VPAAVIAWLVTEDAAREWHGKTVSAQKLCKTLGLVAGRLPRPDLRARDRCARLPAFDASPRARRRLRRPLRPPARAGAQMHGAAQGRPWVRGSESEDSSLRRPPRPGRPNPPRELDDDPARQPMMV
jgi:hypothetical protein